MGIKRYKPKTPGLRFLVAIDRSKLWKGRPLKKLTESIKSSGGRNNHGHITVRNRGGGHKKLYRIIDFKRKLDEHKAIVERIEYDPNRTCFIALIKYNDGIQRYILAPKGIKKGDQVESGEVVPVKDGNCMEIGNMPDGAIVHNVELSPGKGGELARSAGSSAQVIGKAGGFVQVKLPSGEIRKVLSKCRATCGMLSNEDNKNVILGKAGRARWKGNRPRVRGVAMNPVDHPLGGGEGKTSGGRHPVSYSGVPSKGKKTRSKKKSNKMIIRRRK